MYEIHGQYHRSNEPEVIDTDFSTVGYARRILAEYQMAFGPRWGELWIADSNGNRVEG